MNFQRTIHEPLACACAGRHAVSLSGLGGHLKAWCQKPDCTVMQHTQGLNWSVSVKALGYAFPGFDSKNWANKS